MFSPTVTPLCRLAAGTVLPVTGTLRTRQGIDIVAGGGYAMRPPRAAGGNWEDMMRFAPGSKKEETPQGTGRSMREALAGRSIVLVGMPGSGKSAIGRRLAPRLDLTFVDADEEIEKAAGKSIKEIFADHGEPSFRDGERRVIARLLASGPQILATGGGALMSGETRDNIRRSGISVWVKADLSVLVRRVSKRSNRPLFEGRNAEAVMRELMEARYPTYATADIVVESRDVPHDVIVEEIIEALWASPLLGQAADGCEGASS
jgi:shikimate kinase